jgi:hypothetical protein
MYPVFVADIGTLTTPKVSSTKLTFNPSTGQLNATEVNTTSDIAAKTNIRQIDNALEIIEMLHGYRFDWVDTKQPSLGVLAQDLEKPLPELVKRNAEGNLTVNYSGIIPVLIEAVNSLKKQLDEK